MRGLSTAILFDLDSTLFHTKHRWHLSPAVNPESTWEDYSAACAGDSPILGTIKLAVLLWPEHQIHIVSGRNESAEAQTIHQLASAGVPYDGMRLRPAGDYTKNADFKIKYIAELEEQGTKTVLFVEDLPKVADEIEARTSIPTLVVNPRYGDVVGMEAGMVDTD
jgi:FMN phosphatase YigB (HAD superfamily)